MTISSLFIRRPRLAFVVSTVITIAGLLAMEQGGVRAALMNAVAAATRRSRELGG